jgi:EmrB/QacA subfamily drug resistance transporter
MSRGFPRHLIPVAAVVVLGAIMSILDTTIVNVAIATLTHDFGTSLATIQWVSTGYLLALATVIPLTGWAADRFGTKRLYMLAIALFVLGSGLSGLAWSAGSLIAFRVLQGLGGGMIMPVGMTILNQAAGPRRIGRMMSVVGVAAMLAPLLGPVLGGWIVTDISWRWIFYVNLPVGALTLLLALRILPADRSRASERLDLRGLLLLSPGLAALVYGLAETESAGGIASAGAVGGLLAGAILITAFVLHALRHPAPLIDLRLFRHRAVAAASGTTFLLATAFFGTLLLLPLYFQVVRGASPLVAGLLLAPRALGAAITMPIGGRVTDRSGAGRAVLPGLAIAALATLPWVRVGASTSHWLLGGAQFVQGLGIGLAMMPAMSAAYKALERDAVPRATAALSSIQRIGGSIGIALTAVVLQHQIAGITGLTGGAGPGALERGPLAQAKLAPQLAAAFAHTFWWGLLLIALAMLPALFLPRTGAGRKRRPDPDPGEPRRPTRGRRCLPGDDHRSGHHGRRRYGLPYPGNRVRPHRLSGAGIWRAPLARAMLGADEPATEDEPRATHNADPRGEVATHDPGG